MNRRLLACPNPKCDLLLFTVTRDASKACPRCGVEGLKSWRFKPAYWRRNGGRSKD